MRIALVTGKFPAVSETFVVDQATALLRLGHEVHIFANRRGSGPIHADVDRFGLPDRTTYRPVRGRIADIPRVVAAAAPHPLTAARCLNAVRFGRDASSLRLLYASAMWSGAQQFDAVVCHFGPNGVVAAKLRWAGVFDAPLATFFHGSDVIQTDPDRYRLLIERAELLLTISDRFRRQLIEWGATADQVAVQKMGVDLDKFIFAPATTPAEGPIRILSVARLVPVKGLSYAVEAMSALPPDLASRARYEIIGDGPLRQDIQARITQLALHDRVILRGAASHEDVRRAVAEAHIFILPSIVTETGGAEGMGVVLMEAMASGVPVIATRTGGIPELVEHGQTGWLVEQKNPQAIADAIAHLAAHPDLLPPVIEAARAKIERDHNLMIQTAALVDRLAAARRR